MKGHGLAFLMAFFVLCSCTYLMEERPLSFENLPLKDNDQLNYCPTSPDQSIVSSNPYASEIFRQFLKNKQLGFIEKAVMWSLFQLNIRPDASSVHSGLQIIYKINNETFYWNFKTKHHQKPEGTFIYALGELLERHQSRYRLQDLAKILDRELPKTIPIGPAFSNFLSQNNDQLKKYDPFQKTYFKAAQVINARESIPKLMLHDLIRSHPITTKNHYQKIDYMFESKNNPSLKCSFDINAYEHSIFIVSPQKVARHNIFGLTENQKNTFLAVSHYHPQLEPYRDSYLFQGGPAGHQSAVCHYKTAEHEIHLLSGQGRDPGQFIYQFFQNNLEALQRAKDIDQISRQARVLKLYSPDRIVTESHRARGPFLQGLLRSNRPIYHASNLGELTFWLRTNQSHGFITDSRSPTIPLCQK